MKYEEDIKFLVDKFTDDIEELKIKNTELDNEILEKEGEVQKCNRIMQAKDDQISLEQSLIVDMEKQLIAMRVNNEKRQSVVGPLQERLHLVETAVRNVS